MEDIILLGTRYINIANWSKNAKAPYSNKDYKDVYKKIYELWLRGNKKNIYGIGYYVKEIKHVEFYFIKITYMDLSPNEEKIIITYESLANSNIKSEVLYGFKGVIEEEIGDKKIMDISTKKDIQQWLEKNKIEIDLEYYWGNSRNLIKEEKALMYEKETNQLINNEIVESLKKLKIAHISDLHFGTEHNEGVDNKDKVSNVDNITSNLFDNFGYYTGTNSLATFADSKC